VVARAGNGSFFLFPVAGGAPVPLPFLGRHEVPMRFSSDGKALFVASFGKIPAQLSRVDLASGNRVLWRSVIPADPSGLINVGPVFPTPDGQTLVYSYT